MGNIPHPACKVFEVMPARKFLSNFGKTFGGSQTCIHRSGMVVVGFHLVKNCKKGKRGMIFSLFQGLHLATLYWSTWST
jgi:hypothetical protein